MDTALEPIILKNSKKIESKLALFNMSNYMMSKNTQNEISKNTKTALKDNLSNQAKITMNRTGNMFFRILNAEKLEQDLRKKFNDPKLVYKFYDRNKAMRVTFATDKGKAIGTCEKESNKRYYELVKTGKKVMRIVMEFLQADGQTIHHVSNIYIEDGEYRHESISNGFYYNFRWQDYIVSQHLQLLHSWTYDKTTFTKKDVKKFARYTQKSVRRAQKNVRA